MPQGDDIKCHSRASTRKEISFQKDILAFGRKNKRKCDLEGNWKEIRPFGRKWVSRVLVHK
jgi:hypothetical protein